MSCPQPQAFVSPHPPVWHEPKQYLGSTELGTPVLSQQPSGSNDERWCTHVVNDDLEGRPVAYRNTPCLEDRNVRPPLAPGTRVRVVLEDTDAQGMEWVQCSNKLWLVRPNQACAFAFLLDQVDCTSV